MKLKVAFIILIVFFSVQVNAQENATEILANAVSKAKTENKNVFLIFHASWCGWCKKMDEQMSSTELKPLFDKNYVIEHMVAFESKDKKDLETPGGLDFLKKYGRDNTGLPFWIIFDKNGKMLKDSFNAKNENIGCPYTAEEVADFMAILKSTSTLTTANLSSIEKVFSKKDE